MNNRLRSGVAALALLVAAPVAAQADTYPGTDSQTFASGTAGWSGSSTTAGLCLPQLLCPGVVDDWAGSGGADGNGYIRTQFSSLASTLAGTSTGVWQSPAFVYHGNGGKIPAQVSLDLDIRPQITALLGVDLLNDSSYRVDVVDAAGIAVSAVPSTPLVDDTGWTAVPTVHIDPADLTIGATYAIRISTTYHTVAAVVATGEVGYDDVRLTSSGISTDNVNGGSGITSTHQLRQLVRSETLPGSVKLVGHHLTFKVKCPTEAAPLSCKMVLTALAHGKGSPTTTAGQSLKMNAGVVKKVRLTIHRAWLQQYQHATHAFIRARVRVGIFKVNVVKRVTLTH